MKNKRVTYFLLIVVLVIWYKTFSNIFSNIFPEDLSQNVQITPEKIDLSKINRKPFELSVKDDEPFFEQRKNREINSDLKMVAPERINQTIKDQVTWPLIEYIGIVSKLESKDPLILLKIDNQPLTIRINEKLFGGINIQYVDENKITLSNRNHKRTYWRN